MRQNEGPGKSTYMFSAERLSLSAPHQASVGRDTWRRSGKRKSADVRQKTYMLIYPDPLFCGCIRDKGERVLTLPPGDSESDGLEVHGSAGQVQGHGILLPGLLA